MIEVHLDGVNVPLEYAACLPSGQWAPAECLLRASHMALEDWTAR